MRPNYTKPILLPLITLLLLLTPLAQAQDEPSPYDIALQRIEEARLNGATVLVLSGLGLTEVPSEVWYLMNLRALYLDDNQLTSLPPEIVQLNELRHLSLSDNQLRNIPSEIGQLTNLQLLFLFSNRLMNLPPEIGQLTNLQWLVLNGNQLRNIPSEIGQLTNLRVLLLYDNQLQHLPLEMSNLTNLNCPTNCYIDLSNNPLVSPPPEVVEQGTEAILAYLRNQAWYHTQRLILGTAAGVFLLVGLILGLRLRQRGQRKAKVKRAA
jgi:hypothetical protein